MSCWIIHSPQSTSRETWCGVRRGLGNICQPPCIVIEGARSQQIVIGCRSKHVITPSQLLSACSSLKGSMVIGAKAETANNENTSRVFCIIKLSANCNWTQRQTCQNPFSAVVSMFIIEGVYGRRHQGLDHKQPKHLKGVLHNQIEVVRYTAVNNKGEMQEIAIVFRGGFVFSVTPFFLGGGGAA